MEKKRERRGVRSQGRGSRAGLRRRGRIRPGNSRAVVALCRQRDGQGLPARLFPALPSLLCGQSPGTPGARSWGAAGCLALQVLRMLRTSRCLGTQSCPQSPRGRC